MKNAYLLYAVLLLHAIAARAQDNAGIKHIAEKGCDCTKEISLDQPKDSIVSKINSCITASIMEDQMKKVTEGLGKVVDSLASHGKDGDVAAQNKTYTITADKDFDEIQAYMFENCARLKKLMSANNGKLDYSMSKNKKALTFYEEGVAYESRGQHDMAIVSYNKALKADSKFSFAWDNLGLCYRKMGNYKQAIKSYEKSLELDPKGTTPLQNIAVAYEYLKDFKQANVTYEKFITLHPDNPEGYFGAGRMSYNLEDYAKGVDYMFKAYKLYGAVKSPYINDAQQNLQYYYSDLDKKGKLDLFKDAAKKNNVDIK